MVGPWWSQPESVAGLTTFEVSLRRCCAGYLLPFLSCVSAYFLPCRRALSGLRWLRSAHRQTAAASSATCRTQFEALHGAIPLHTCMGLYRQTTSRQLSQLNSGRPLGPLLVTLVAENEFFGRWNSCLLEMSC